MPIMFIVPSSILDNIGGNSFVGTYGFKDLIDCTLTYGGFSDHIGGRVKSLFCQFQKQLIQ